MIQRLTNSIFTILKISDLCWSSPLVLRLHNRTPSFFSQEFFAFWSQAHHLLTSFPYSTLSIHNDQHSTFKKKTSPSGCQVPSANVQGPECQQERPHPKRTSQQYLAGPPATFLNVVSNISDVLNTWGNKLLLTLLLLTTTITTVSGRTTGNLFKCCK